ncbi:protein kinase domain-containing protein [Ramlibacter sp.]|uniref:protein kinase domain-containing protein n=1 Tax=Ramlibacter sp. TaxID=1917967 RepID=UPI003D109F33
MSERPAPPAPPPAADGDEATLPAGYRINEYEIERTLGGGGFGITYLARDGNLDLPVAVKEYFPNDLATRSAGHAVRVRSGDPEAKGTYEWGLERFLDEARALATFRHPNIVRVLRYFRENGTAYIVMEYESGQPLKRWLPTVAPLSQRTVLDIVYPLLDGLEQVHKGGFLHRDIKPDNIYVRADNSPVLLDFGSARRVQSGRDLTNIVSPGFAPFEQYHSHGKQGAWSDIYSLGAVMYWMVTGKKPLESASRVQKDGMEPASRLAAVPVFGAELLRVIEWAMHPDESRRPQTVAEFRAALRGAELGAAGPQSLAASANAGARPMSVTEGAASAPTAPSAPTGPSAQNRNRLGTILFLDLVGYSIKSVDNQVQLKKLFNELIAKALRGVPEDTRIAIDTGDGAAICFLDDPEEALHSALLLRDLLGQKYGTAIHARIGLHLGPVRVIQDINNRVNVIGDGINVAQRVMDFAQPNQVLVSRSYYDVISRLTDDTADMFQYLGQYPDKHERLHEVYAVVASQRNVAADPTRLDPDATTRVTRTMPTSVARDIDDGAVLEVEAELARHIGPLAKVLVKKARPLAASAEQLRESLAPSIPDQKARTLFLLGSPIVSQPPSHPVPSRPFTMPFSQPRGGASAPPPVAHPPTVLAKTAPMPRTQPMSQPMSQPLSQPMSRPGAPTAKVLDLSPEEVAGLELALSKGIGPMAKMLVRKELGRAGSVKELVQALCENFDSLEQRDAFTAAAKRALGRRSF